MIIIDTGFFSNILQLIFFKHFAVVRRSRMILFGILSERRCSRNKQQLSQNRSLCLFNFFDAWHNLHLFSDVNATRRNDCEIFPGKG